MRSCALTDGGAIVCWDGYINLPGELAAGPYVALDVSGLYGCALTERGEAVCGVGPCARWRRLTPLRASTPRSASAPRTHAR